MATTAWAGPALDESTPATASPATPEATTEVASTSPDNVVQYGLAIGLRQVFVPASMIGLFVARTPGGSSTTGVRLEATRRRGSSELQLGMEFEHLQPQEGVFIASGDNVAAGAEADFILSPEHSGNSFGWFTIEFTFMNNAEINKYVSFRYGGGAGLGILTGELDHYNIICHGATNSMPEPGCVPPGSRFNGQGSYSEGTETIVKYDTKSPVYPVVNAIIGVQFKPTDKVVINLETGIRTIPFIGLSTGYYF